MVDRAAIRQLLAELPGRERRILYLRFFEQMSQAEIAAQVGTSQVHVGRLLQRQPGQAARPPRPRRPGLSRLERRAPMCRPDGGTG